MEMLEQVMEARLKDFRKEMAKSFVPKVVSKEINTMAIKLGMDSPPKKTRKAGPSKINTTNKLKQIDTDQMSPMFSPSPTSRFPGNEGVPGMVA